MKTLAACVYDRMKIPLLAFIRRMTWKPEPFYRWLARQLAIWIYRPRYSGFERIPASGAAVLICNHVSYVDGLIVTAGVDMPVRFIIDAEIYHLPGVHYVMRYNRAIPILPTRASVSQALEEVSQALRQGDLVCIFPEGQLTYTGSLGRFKTGIESIIKRDAVPVYPLAITGLWGSVFSRKYRGSWKRFLPKRFTPRVHAICGAPIAPEDVTVNRLQEAVLRLKYQASEG